MNVAKNNTLDFPSEALVGSLGEFAKVMAQGTEVPEEFYFAAGLTFVGAVAAGTLKVGAALDLEPRLYTLLLGESADVKKSTALRRTAAFLGELWAARQPVLLISRGTRSPTPLINWGTGSAEGLARKLNESPAGVVLAYDEMQSFVEKTKVQASVLLPMVASLFEQTAWDNATKAKSSVSLRDAHLSIVGCCTIDTYSGMWTPEAIAIGFPNRLFVVSADRKRKVAWPEPPDAAALDCVRAHIQRQIDRLPITLDINPDAKAEWERWYESLPGSVHAKRLDTIGFRLLALLAFTNDKYRIDLETVKSVTALLRYEMQLRVMTDPVDADNRIAHLEQRIRQVLRVKGPLKKRVLRNYTNANRYGLWAFQMAIDNLRKAGDIAYRGGVFALRVHSDGSKPEGRDG